LKNATVEAGTYFYDLKTVAAKNGFAFYLQLKTKLVLQRWFCFCSLTCQPTVCVTRAGAGGGTPSDWKKAEA